MLRCIRKTEIVILFGGRVLCFFILALRFYFIVAFLIFFIYNRNIGCNYQDNRQLQRQTITATDNYNDNKSGECGKMSGLVVMKQMIIIFALIMAGFLLYKKHIISSAASKDMSALVLNLCSPALIISSMFSDLSTISRKDVGLVALIGVLCFAFLIILGYALTKILRVPVSQKEAYILMTVFGNLGFIGLPVASAVLGPKSMVYVIVFNFLFNVVIFTFGIMLVKKRRGGVEQSWTDIFSPGLLPASQPFLSTGSISGFRQICSHW